MADTTILHLDEVPAERVRFVIVAALSQEHWLFVKEKDCTAWSLPQTSVEPGETPRRAAERLLGGLDERGPAPQPVCALGGDMPGMVFFAKLTVDKPTVTEKTLWEPSFFPTIPEDLARPETDWPVFHQVQAWRNLQTNANELWDVYDEDRHITGETHRRGDPMPYGKRHLAVHVWIRQPDGKYLLTQRAPNKGYPGMWECTGGSALAGDSSLRAALREAKEETGVTLDPENGRMLLQRTGEDYFLDVWLFDQRVIPQEITLQKGETTDFRFAAPQEILTMLETGMLVPFSYLRELFSLADT